MPRFKDTIDKAVREGKARIVWTPEGGWTDQDKRDIQALDRKIEQLAKDVWDTHPNNPKNKR